MCTYFKFDESSKYSGNNTVGQKKPDLMAIIWGI
jgi:hypothetical protein